jgi:hypothetical protein
MKKNAVMLNWIVSQLAFRDSWIDMKANSAPVSGSDAAGGQRQILRNLAAEYGRQLAQILRVGELLKGSVYQIQTRCGNPGCHCAKPRGRRHPATVLSWSEAGRTRMRCLPLEERARVRRLSEQYRSLRQARAALVRLQQQILCAIDGLEEALRLLPPASASRRRRG